MEIIEEKIKTGKGIFFSTLIDGKKYVSKILRLSPQGAILTKEQEYMLEKWKRILKQQVINKINENNSI